MDRKSEQGPTDHSAAGSNEAAQGTRPTVPVAYYAGVDMSRYTIEWKTPPYPSLPIGAPLYAAPPGLEEATALLAPFLAEYLKRDPIGDSDLYDEQPVHITVTLGDLRRVQRAIRSNESKKPA